MNNHADYGFGLSRGLYVLPGTVPDVGRRAEDFAFGGLGSLGAVGGGLSFDSVYSWLPSVESAVPAVPTNFADARQFYTRTLSAMHGGASGAQAIAGSALAAIGAGASAAAALAPIAASCAAIVPAGTIVAAAAAIGSLLLSLFGRSPPPPPPPDLKGLLLTDLYERPLHDENRAAFLGKVVSGFIAGDEADALGRNTSRSMKNYFTNVMNERPSTIGALGDYLRDKQFVGGRSPARAFIYFLCSVGTDWLYVDPGLPSTGEERTEQAVYLGKLLKWGAPRMQLREMLFNWFCYRVALNVWSRTGDNPNRSLDDSSPRGTNTKFTFPIPSMPFRPLNDWNPFWDSRKTLTALNGADNSGVTYLGWAGSIFDLAMPAPWPVDQEIGLAYSYAPIPRAVLDHELENWYAPGPAASRPQPDINRGDQYLWSRPGLTVIYDLAVKDKNVIGLGLPKPKNRPAFMYFPETWAQAALYCFKLPTQAVSATASGSSAYRYVAEEAARHREAFDGQMSDMRAIRTGLVSPAAARTIAQRSLLRLREEEQRQVKAKMRVNPVTTQQRAKRTNEKRAAERPGGGATLATAAAGSTAPIVLALSGAALYALAKMAGVASARKNPTRRRRSKTKRRRR